MVINRIPADWVTRFNAPTGASRPSPGGGQTKQAWPRLFRASKALPGLLLAACLGALAGALPPAPVSTPLRAYRHGSGAPVRVAADPAGRLYTTDAATGSVLVRDEFGRLLDIHRGWTAPLGIAAGPDGRIYVGDGSTGSVSVFLDNWAFLGKLGRGDGEFQMPNHIAVATDGSGVVYVVDSSAALVKAYEPVGPFLRQWGGHGSASGLFDFPTGIYAASSGEIFVADENNDRIQVFTPSGQYLRSLGRKGMMGFGTTFGRIQGLTGDSQGRLYVADTLEGVIRVMDGSGNDIVKLGAFGDGPGQMNGPTSLAIDRNNRLFVASPGGGRIEVYGLDQYSDPKILAALVEARPPVLRRLSPEEGEGLERTRADRNDDPPERRGPRIHLQHRLRPVGILIKVPGVSPDLILPQTIRVQGLPAQERPQAQVADFDGDGQAELRVWIDRRRLLLALPDGRSDLIVRGQASGGVLFEGTTPVTVTPGEDAGPEQESEPGDLADGAPAPRRDSRKDLR